MLGHILWILAAAGLSFVVAATFAGGLGLKRNGYLVAYILIAGGFVAEYYFWSATNILDQLQRGWISGLVAAGVTGLIAVRSVLSQPYGPRSQRARLVLDVIWSGTFYGLVDGMLLSVFPIMATQNALTEFAWTDGILGQMGLGALALLASLVVALAYHLGYAEFRSRRVIWALAGNGIFSLAFIVSGNPLAAVLPHIAMHVAAVVHGPDATLQLPPHTKRTSTSW